jgi:hypothetical protein
MKRPTLYQSIMIILILVFFAGQAYLSLKKNQPPKPVPDGQLRPAPPAKP